VANTSRFEGRRDLPLECDHFTTEMLDLSAPLASDLPCSYLLVVTRGEGRLEDHPFKAGDVWEVGGGHGPLTLIPDGSARVLRTRCDRSIRSQDPPPIPAESHTAGK
jgi:hypothetical protein